MSASAIPCGPFPLWRPAPESRPPGSLPEPPQSAAEKKDRCGAVSRPTRPSPLGVRPGARPQPRGMAGNSPPDRAPGADSPESRTTWWSEWNSNFQYSLWGESEANPNRPTWQQRKTRAAAYLGPRTRSLRFGYTRTRRPKPRGIAGISRAVPGCGRKVSATADWVAERMEFELPVFPVGRIGSETEPPN